MSVVEWRERDADPEAVEAAASRFGLSRHIARAIVSRGISGDEIEPYLSASLKDISDPFCIAGIREAGERLWSAVEKGEKILIYGDYDCDGLTSTALLYRFLKGVGHDNVETFIPDRLDDGYGLISECVKRCFEAHSPDLVVTVDCGVNSVEEVELIKSHGADVIVTDHHEPGAAVSKPTVLVNPKIGSPQKVSGLAGVGVAFMLAYGTVKVSGIHRSEEAFDIRGLLGYAALGTVADIVPLTNDNRIIVKAGLANLRSAPPVGIAALMEVAGISPLDLDAYHFGFLLGPRVNAAGRLGKADVGLRLLLTDDADAAGRIASELDEANRERKSIEDVILKEAIAMIEALGDPPMGIVVAAKGWHAGTLGIVASRLVGMFNRPAIVISIDADGNGKGSCRSVEQVNLAEVLQECDELLTSHGGHAMAAGVGLREERLDDFSLAFAEKCAARCAGTEFPSIMDFDAWVDPGDLTLEFCGSLEKLKPLGMGNPSPVWGIRGLTYSSVRIFKDRHLSFMLNGTQKVIGFNMAAREAELPPGPIDLLVEAKINEFRGRRSVDLVLQDFRPAGC